jgi:hypothetical protein
MTQFIEKAFGQSSQHGVLPANFPPGQILYLEDSTTRLYSETIQTIPDRQLCWARPLALVTGQLVTGQDASDQSFTWVDLREGSDLLLPIALFQVALDTEMIPVFMALEGANRQDTSLDKLVSAANRREAHQQMQAFIRQICRSNADVFRPAQNYPHGE